MVGEPRTLNYAVETSQPGGTATNAPTLIVNTRLADVYRGDVFGPKLAEAIPSTDNGLWVLNPDGTMVTTWHIRPGVLWQDGTPFTSADLLFTTMVGQDKDLPAFRDPAYASINSIEAPDPNTIVVNWKQPYIAAVAWLGDTEPLPEHLLRSVYEQDKANFTANPFFTDNFVGTGPFRLTAWDHGSAMTFAAFNQYALGQPKLDELELRFILDAEVILAGALAGTIDTTIGPRVSLEQGEQAKQRWTAGRSETVPDNWVALFPQFINPTPATLADVRLRKALMYGTDRQQLTDVLNYGRFPVPNNYLLPSDALYNDTLPSAVTYPFEPNQAMQLLTDLGYTKGADGIDVDRAGQRLVVEIRTTSGDDQKSKLMLTLADMWKQLGIDAPTVEIPRQLSNDLEYRQTRPAFELVRQPDDFTANGLKRFKSSEAALPENGYQGQNRTRYQNPELDSLVDRFVATIPLADRVDLARQLVHLLTDQLPIMGMIYAGSATLIADRLVNVTGVQNTRNVEQWDVQ